MRTDGRTTAAAARVVTGRKTRTDETQTRPRRPQLPGVRRWFHLDRLRRFPLDGSNQSGNKWSSRVVALVSQN